MPEFSKYGRRWIIIPALFLTEAHTTELKKQESTILVLHTDWRSHIYVLESFPKSNNILILKLFSCPESTHCISDSNNPLAHRHPFELNNVFLTQIIPPMS